jgi:CubicO group peptidase (beta-lactamase class C family)
MACKAGVDAIRGTSGLAKMNGPVEYYAEGRFGQFVYLVPDLDLVIVRVGRDDGIISWRRFLSGQAAQIREAEGTG